MTSVTFLGMGEVVGFDISLEFINGLKVGIEHLALDEEDDEEVQGVVIVDLLFLRVSFISYR